MIDTNGLNAALTALIRPIVLEIVEREFSVLEHIKAQVSVANKTFDANRKLLASLETAIETLGKRVDDHKDEAEGVTDGVLGRITRLERDLEVLTKRIGDDMDNFAAGQDADRTRLDGRIDAYGNMLSSLETAIETLGKRVTESVRETNAEFYGVGKRIDYGETRLNEARAEIAALKPSNQLDPLRLVSTPTIDALVKETVNAYLPTDYVTREEVKDMMREIMRDEVVIQFDLT